MSISMNRLTLSDALLAALTELAGVRPCVPDAARFSTDQWAAYRDGYYTALCAALRAQQAVIDRRAARDARELVAARAATARRLRQETARPTLRLVTLRRKGAA